MKQYGWSYTRYCHNKTEEQLTITSISFILPLTCFQHHPIQHKNSRSSKDQLTIQHTLSIVTTTNHYSHTLIRFIYESLAASATNREFRISPPPFPLGTKVVLQCLAEPTSRTQSKYCVRRSRSMTSLEVAP